MDKMDGMDRIWNDGQDGEWQYPSAFMQLLYQNQQLNIKTEAKKGLTGMALK